MAKKMNENVMSTFEATMRACQENKEKAQKETNKTLKESKKLVTEADDIDAGIDEFDNYEEEVVDFDGEPIEGDDLPKDVFDDVAVIIDPDLDPEQVTDSIDELQQLIDETPDGEVPTSDEYVGDITYTCPICGNKFFNDTELKDGDECPVCGETPEAFILMGEVSKLDDTEEKEEEPKEDSEEEVEVEEEINETEEIEESKKVEEGCSDKDKEDKEDEKEVKEESKKSDEECEGEDCKEKKEESKKEESAQQLELDAKPVWTPPKRSNRRPKVKTVSATNALKAERARRRARALRRARRMEQSRRARRVRPVERRRVENRVRPTRRPISRRPRMESRVATRRPVKPTYTESRRRPMRRPVNRRVENRIRQSINTIEERSFNRLLTKFVNENYKNIESMEVKNAKLSKGTLTLECVLNRKDDSNVNANIVIENFKLTNGRGRFVCDVDKVFSPKAEAKTRNSFIIECRQIGRAVRCSGFRYNFITENKKGTYKVSGLCK